MDKSNLLKEMLSDKEGKSVLLLLLVIYVVYFVTSLVFIWGVTYDMIAQQGDFDISDGKATLFIFFIGQLVYLFTHPEKLEWIFKYKKMDRIVIASIFISLVIILVIRGFYEHS